jgi:hypothetical protein
MVQGFSQIEGVDFRVWDEGYWLDILGLEVWMEPDEIFSKDTEEVYHDGHEVHGHTYDDTSEEVVWRDRHLVYREHLMPIYGWAMTILLGYNKACMYLCCGTYIYDWSPMMKYGCQDMHFLDWKCRRQI